MVSAVVDLVLLCGLLLICGLRRPRRLVYAAAWALALVSAAWLPLNNGHLEGPILLTFGQQHGLTLSDLIGISGIAVSMLTLWRRTHGTTPADLSRRAAIVAIGAGGILAAYYLQPR